MHTAKMFYCLLFYVLLFYRQNYQTRAAPHCIICIMNIHVHDIHKLSRVWRWSAGLAGRLVELVLETLGVALYIALGAHSGLGQ